MGFRISILIGLFSLSFASLIFKLYEVQIYKGDYYEARAASIQQFSKSLLPLRGNIYFSDREGNAIPAAINKNYPSIFVVPSEVKEEEMVINFLSELTGKDKEKFREILSNKNDPYEPVLKKASDEEVRLTEEKNLVGVEVGFSPGRFYPLGNIASHLLGYVSSDEEEAQGKYGIELYEDDALRGEKGRSKGDKFDPPRNGENIYLTIDRNIQVESERILGKLIEERQATGGTVIVEAPKTGRILAMASFPNFNPNDYGKFDIKNFLNPAVQAIYEPGSIFKVITMAGGLDAGKITPDTTYFDKGSLTLNGRRIENYDLKTHGPYGKVTMTNVIEHSINTGAAFAEKVLGHDLFYNYLIKFGFKKKTGIDLPGEVQGNLSPLEKNSRDINFATASYGQGISVTPIELIQAIGVIANHGIMMRPYVNVNESPKALGRVISDEASREVTQMMISAVEKAGVATIKGYTVAGKTGTALVPDFVQGGYTEEVINTYVGFAPASDPEFVILIKLDKPASAPVAALTVVPAFRDLANFILTYLNIPPDTLVKRQ